MMLKLIILLPTALAVLDDLQEAAQNAAQNAAEKLDDLQEAAQNVAQNAAEKAACDYFMTWVTELGADSECTRESFKESCESRNPAGSIGCDTFLDKTDVDGRCKRVKEGMRLDENCNEETAASEPSDAQDYVAEAACDYFMTWVTEQVGAGTECTRESFKEACQSRNPAGSFGCDTFVDTVDVDRRCAAVKEGIGLDENCTEIATEEAQEEAEQEPGDGQPESENLVGDPSSESNEEDNQPESENLVADPSSESNEGGEDEDEDSAVAGSSQEAIVSEAPQRGLQIPLIILAGVGARGATGL